jgi:hypothetical protein
MSVYNTGAVTVKVGSSEVIGNSTSFQANVQAGFYFRLTSSAVWYEVATINTATRLQLSTRYADTAYETAQNPENVASVIVATKMYSGTLENYPVMQGDVVFNAATRERFTDDSGGILTGNDTPAGSGTIDYDTGAWTLILGASAVATLNLAASYLSGETLSAMPYQIVTDYTTYYGIPELSGSDTNIHYVYTKGVRIIDAALKSFSASITSYEASIDTLQSDVTGINASINSLQSTVTATYLKVGSIYLMSGTVQTDSAASVLAAARTVIIPVPKGSMFYNASPAWPWVFTATVTATKVK